MGDKRTEIAPDADEKLQANFESWASGKGITFQGPEAEARYRDRVTLIIDAIQMKKIPRRVPVCPVAGYFALENAGVLFHDAMYDSDTIKRAWMKYYDEFDPDIYSGPLLTPGKICDLLDLKSYRWPGHGVPMDQEYQFVEKEYMKADEYDDLINDPSGYHLKTYFPRICGALKSLEKLPILANLHSINNLLAVTLPFSLPEVQETLKALLEAGALASRWTASLRELGASIMGRGYPSFFGGMAVAPFDAIGDALRGTQGILLDMFRRPDKLLEACEQYVPLMIRQGVAAFKTTGNPLVFMPLHKGADDFMSNEQYMEFYWPSLRKVMIGLINEGLVPVAFAEGRYEARLEIISDLPENKTVWWFERTDMARAKETVGKIACIAGNVPNALFRAGTPDEMKDYCKNLIDVAGKGGGFILSTAAGLQGAKAENVAALIDFSKEYGIYK